MTTDHPINPLTIFNYTKNQHRTEMRLVFCTLLYPYPTFFRLLEVKATIDMTPLPMH